MGILGAAMALGVILGPGLGGWLAGESLSTPFFIAAGLSLVSLLLIFFLLPESLPVKARQPFDGTQDKQIKGKVSTVQFGELWRALFSPIGVLLLMVSLFSFALTNFEAIFGLYALEKFGYGPERVGTILTKVLVEGGLFPPRLAGLLTLPVARHGLYGQADLRDRLGLLRRERANHDELTIAFRALA